MKRILKYIAELIVVAFGVFLGFYLNNLNADKSTKRAKEKTLELILKELQENEKSIQKSIRYHESIKKQMDSIIPTLDESEFEAIYYKGGGFRYDQLKGWQGFIYSKLDNTAFEGAKISGVLKDFDIETIQEISAIYQLQEAYGDFGTNYTNRVFTLNSSSKTVDILSLLELMTVDLLFFEKRLSKQLGLAINQLRQ